MIFLDELVPKVTVLMRVEALHVVSGVVQFYPWFKFYLPLFLGMAMDDNEFETRENKI